jgi:hypothetical protein
LVALFSTPFVVGGGITVTPSDPNIVYVGMGEPEIRSNISYSDRKDKKGKPLTISKEFYEDVKLKRPGTLPTQTGLNQFVWECATPMRRL